MSRHRDMSGICRYVVMPFLLLIAAIEFQLAAANSSSNSTSFSLELIHRDSPKSPFYLGNLTFFERVKKYMEISESRASYLFSITTNYNKTMQPDMMHPYVFTDKFTYMVKLEIGTPSKEYLLTLDTGAGQIWTQCQPCEHCFSQKGEIFDPQKSSSYQSVPCDNPLCQLYSCTDGKCYYDLHYGKGKAIAKGVASWETFNFMSHGEGNTAIKGVLFGCTHWSQGFEAKKGVSNSAGILGMSQDPISLISQLGSSVLKRFSYCFVEEMPNGTLPTSYLKFGTDMGYKGGSVQTTPIVKHPNSYAYGLNLLDISVGNKRLNFAPGTFKVQDNGVGGFIIDSGSVVSYLQTEVYWKVHNEIDSFFSPITGVYKFSACPPPVQLCYTMPSNYDNFISLTYHFEGANLKIEPKNLFIILRDDKAFMLAVAPLDSKNVLGVWQQRNTRFVYDLNDNSLWFAPENCTQDQG